MILHARVIGVLTAAIVPVVGWAARAEPELFIDPWRAPALVKRIAADPGLLNGFSRVHLLVFSNGQTAYRTQVAPFAQGPALAGKRTMAQCRRACDEAGVECHWAADLLLWERADVDSSGLFGKRPEWFELGHGGGCGSGADPGRYACPFREEVCAALQDIAAEIAQQEPAPDGFTISCRLSPYEMLGYSVAFLALGCGM